MNAVARTFSITALIIAGTLAGVSQIALAEPAIDASQLVASSQAKLHYPAELLELLEALKVPTNPVSTSAKQLSPPADAAPSTLTLNKNYLSDVPKVLGRGLPFKAITSSDPIEKQGAEILWNMQSIFWANKSEKHAVRISIFDGTKLVRGMRAVIRRVYPHAISDADKTSQLFREIVTFTDPAAIQGLAWLTFRFFSNDEDLLWIYSPAIKKTRQLTAANRADEISRTAIAPDDIFTFSGKIDGIKITAVSKTTKAVPFSREPSRAVNPADSKEKCWNIASEPDVGSKKETGGPVSTETSNLSSFFDGIEFVLRDVYEVDLSSSDFYSVYGRQRVYIDAESYLPVYKVAFDKGGNLVKLVVSAFDVARTTDSSKSAVYPHSSLVFDSGRKVASALHFTSSMYCDEPIEGLKLSDFEPRKLVPLPPVARAAASVLAAAGIKSQFRAPESKEMPVRNAATPVPTPGEEPSLD